MPDNVFKTWFIDGFTIHPRQLADLLHGIWERGRTQPVQSAYWDTSDTDLPSVLCYIAAHHEHGLRAFYPASGCSKNCKKCAPNSRLMLPSCRVVFLRYHAVSAVVF